MKVLAAYQVGVGGALAGLWVLLLATGQVPEVAEGLRSIWFHIAAEATTAALLLLAGLALLREPTPRARLRRRGQLGAG